MKVCIVSDYLPKYHKSWSGAELIAVTLSDILKSKGVDTFFLTSSFDFAVKNDDTRVYPIRRMLKKLGTLSRNFPLDMSANRAIRKILEREKPDVVHINAKNLMLPTITAGSKLSIPIIYTVADYFIFCPTVFLRKPDGAICTSYNGESCYECLHYLTEGCLKKIAAITPEAFVKILLALRAKQFERIHNKITSYVALTNASKRRLVKFGIPEKKVKVIYHYRLTSVGKTKEIIKSPSAVFVGRLSEDNGIHVLVKAFGRVVKEIPSAKLYLIGAGKASFMEKLKRDILALNTEANIIFLGVKENEDALSIVSKCDLTVVPHQWPKEFGPVILVEALALGKPVITSNIGGTDEFVKNGENGFLVDDFGNEKAFAGGITFLFKNPEKMKRMGINAGKSVCSVLGETAAVNIVKLYKSILNGENHETC